MISKSGDETTTNDRRDHSSKNHGKIPDTGPDCRGTFDSLEPDRNEVNKQEESSSGSDRKQCGSSNATLRDDSFGYGCIVAASNLDTDEDDAEDGEQNEQSDDAAAVPQVS
jgi:hypothetical protein